MWLRSVVAAPGGGDPSHTASARAPDETGTLADSSRLASRARWRAPDTATGSPAPPASISVPSNAKRTPPIHASLSLLSPRRIRAFHANRTHVARTLHARCTRVDAEELLAERVAFLATVGRAHLSADVTTW